jgi:hypothetical protein
VSILVTWEPPSDERGGAFVTGYEVMHQLSLPVDSNPIRQTQLSNSTFLLRVSDLIPDLSYQIIVVALIGDLRGVAVMSVQSTLEIGNYGWSQTSR